MAAGLQSLLCRLRENDTSETLKMGKNFGENGEYFCMFLQKYYFRPWWMPEGGVEFRPFRNVRIHKKYKKAPYQKIGFYYQWFLNPAYLLQEYINGQPCEKHTTPITTYVTFLCGIDNRITGFRETKPCKTYELIFETPFRCDKETKAIVLNKLAIKRHGTEDFGYMYTLLFALIALTVMFIGLILVKKTRIY